MLDPQVVVVFGLERDEILPYVLAAGGIVVGAVVLIMLLASVVPAYSSRWAEQLGGTPGSDTAPDPKETIPGLAAPDEHGDGETDGDSDEAAADADPA